MINLRNCLFAALLLSTAAAHAELGVGRLRCESLENPVGIDSVAPKLSWALESKERNQRQTAYQIIVASSPEALANANWPSPLLMKNWWEEYVTKKADLWDSGRVVSDETLYIPYGGRALRSGESAFWRVRAWDGDGKVSGWSKVASFDMGVLSPADWGGKWIGGSADMNLKPAPLLRKGFEVGGKVKRARAFICGLGYCELRINGRKVGDHVLDPGYTNFDKTDLYATYDVTKALRSGSNAVGVMLGNGWFNVQPLAVWTFDKAPWRAAPKLLMRLEIELLDGTKQTIVTDESWRASTGPITADSLYSGEDYDARLEKPGWDRASFDDSKWALAVVVDAPKGKLTAQTMPPIRVTKDNQSCKDYGAEAGRLQCGFRAKLCGISSIEGFGTSGNYGYDAVRRAA